MTPTPMLDAEAVDDTTEDEEAEREEVGEDAAAAKKVGAATSPLLPITIKRKELTPRYR